MANAKKSIEDDHPECRPSKAKRHDLEPPPTDDVDTKLAERLDNILKVSETRKPKFFMNKPRVGPDTKSNHLVVNDNINQSRKLTKRNLSKSELNERLIKRYETLVPELDPQRPKVNVVKVLSVTESLEMAKSQAKRQLDRQLELNSVAKNQQAHQHGLGSFRFSDGYETPSEQQQTLPTGSRVAIRKPTSIYRSTIKQTNEGEKAAGSKSVKFAGDDDRGRFKPVESNQLKDNQNDGEDDSSTDDLTESDYTTSDEDNCDDKDDHHADRAEL